jgi:hypothetical protein
VSSAEPPREVAGDADPPREAPVADGMSRGYARSRARTEAIQAGLQPLGPDERPLGIKLAVALALFIGVATLVAAAAGAGGESPVVGVVWAGLMCALALGLWRRIYLVILLFQALLAISIIVSALSLAFAGNLAGVALALGIILACSPVFWLLVRVMARLQVPRA